jgi:hypothetical protein
MGYWPPVSRPKQARLMLVELDPRQAPIVLGAMRRVATAAGSEPLHDADRSALAAFHHFVLRGSEPLDVDALREASPSSVAAAIQEMELRTHVVQFLIVMALVDGSVDRKKIAIVREYADALGVHEDAVLQLAELGRGNLAWLRADIARQNLKSITGREVDESIDEWILPYRGTNEQPQLATRYRELTKLPVGTLGRTFVEFYRDNGFAFPGESTGLNERFASPHDSTHILSGYDTSPQGELLVSTFTAGMHRQEPMSGHILPVILSWHLGIELAKLPGKITGQLDPAKFWAAWERGSEVAVDVFSDSWNLWDAAGESLERLRSRYRIAPLEPALAASGEVPPWYRPIA